MDARSVLVFALAFILVSVAVSAQYTSTPNAGGAANPVANLTMLAAFIGGFLMLLAPCSFSVIPAYFAYSVKSKSKVMLSTFIFFLGFALMFSLFGLSAGYVGYYLNLYKFSLALYSGIAMIAVGLLILAGKNFSFFKRHWNFKRTLTGQFLFGTVYAFGYAGCAGPILVGVLIMAATQPPLTSTLTMFSYSLGLGVPLMIISYFFDRFRVFSSKVMERSVLKFGKRFSLPLSSLISSVLFIVIGAVFIADQSLGRLDFANNNLTSFSYSLQRLILQQKLPFGNILFFVALAAISIFILKQSGYILNGAKRDRKASKTQN